MSKRINWTEEHLEARINVSYYSGIREGIQRVMGWMRTMSGDAYAHGNDELAKMLRTTAEEIKKDIFKDATEQADRCVDELKEVEKEDKG